MENLQFVLGNHN
jgi:Ca2+-binding EF-hand superfamily protein